MPTLSDLDLSSARRISHYRYVRNDAPTPEGWTDDGPCPGHHGNWSRMATKEPEMALTPDQTEAVNRPAHYTQGKFETIDVIEDIVQHYQDPVVAGLIWQVLKYISRSPHKGKPQEDLQKAGFYLRRAINKSVIRPARDD
jgi:hypothetical protein